MQEFKDYIVILVGVVTTISIGVNIYFQSKSFNLQNKLFNLQKSKENENELFKLKLDAYSSILGALDTLLNKIFDSISEYFEINHTQDELDDLADYIDDEVEKFDNLVISKSLYFSDNTTIAIEDIVIKLYHDTDTLTKSNYNDYYSKFLDLANDLNDIIREELQLDKLNHNLYKRNKDI